MFWDFWLQVLAKLRFFVDRASHFKKVSKAVEKCNIKLFYFYTLFNLYTLAELRKDWPNFM